MFSKFTLATLSVSLAAAHSKVGVVGSQNLNGQEYMSKVRKDKQA